MRPYNRVKRYFQEIQGILTAAQPQDGVDVRVLGTFHGSIIFFAKRIEIFGRVLVIALR